MKNLILLLIVGVCCCTRPRVIDVALFRIIENNKVGFIDSTGKVIIKPQFLNADNFSEGLAAARINGTYGYIDETGAFAIEAKYDYATPFQEGLAIVYLDGQPFYIDKEGKKPFDVHYPRIRPFKYGRAQVGTYAGKTGFINQEGKLVIDTVFKRINSFIEGLAVVRGLNHQEYEDEEKGLKKNFEVGVIDTLGRFIIPYGKYKDIKDLVNGYFKIDIPEEPWDTLEGFTLQTGFVDKKGKLIIARDYRNSSQIDGDVNSGLVAININKPWLSEDKRFTYSDDKSYDGFMNLKGEIVINDTTFYDVEDFSENRAFVKSNDKYSLIDTKGKILADTAYVNIKGKFRNGKAFVETEDGWGLIDTTGNFILKPIFEDITTGEIVDDYFFFESEEPDKKGNYHNLIGVAKTDGKVLIMPAMQQVDLTGFHNDLLQCYINERLTYLNKKGKIIWQAGKDKPLENTNLDCMNRGYFYATSERNGHDLGGFGGSSNNVKVLGKSHNFPVNQLNIVAKPSPDNKGISVVVSNTTNGKIDFYAQDSRLYMKVQALDKKGVWRDIEYLPNSWCGNSYHTLSLKPDEYWEFKSPAYKGDFQTKLRV
ncbi:MAG TPA: WG repeat-containing protein, partial [Emticicia sp.]